MKIYGLDFTSAPSLIQDPTGDRLDAVLAVIQAAWAYTQRARNYGIPTTCDPLEGWIVDPGLYTKYR